MSSAKGISRRHRETAEGQALHERALPEARLARRRRPGALPPRRRGRDLAFSPAAPVFHTSASSRTIRSGGIIVRMVHTSNRHRLHFAAEATGVALSALWYLGKNNVTPETVATIAPSLGRSAFE